MKQPALSIIIPTYKEAARIERSLDDLADYLKRHKLISVEVLVVDTGSPDGTAALAKAKAASFGNFRVVEAGPRMGKGHNVRIGMLEATGQYRLFMDADMATPLYYIKDVQRLIREKADVIIAVRNLTSSHTGLRKLLSSAGNWLVRVLLLPGISDTQCGFKAFSATAAEECFRRQTILGWGFDMEILAIAQQRNYRIAQIEVPDWVDKPDGTFEDAMTSAAFKTLGELMQIKWQRLTGKYRNKSFNYRPTRD